MQHPELDSLKGTVQKACWDLLQVIEKLESQTQRVEDAAHGAHPKRRFRRGKLVKAVAAAVPKMTGGFTARHVRKEIEKTDAEFAAQIIDSSLSATLGRLRTVRVTRQGMGRRPTWYQFVGKST